MGNCVLLCDVGVYEGYGRVTFSSVFAITERRDIGLYDVPMSLLGLGTGV